jgi:thymidylate kinase
VRQAYLQLAGAHPDDWSVIDGRESIESVASKVRTEVMGRVLPKFTTSAAGAS